MEFENSIEFARSLDDKDALRHFRQRFFIPQFKGKEAIYFTGNSLGLQPKTVREYVGQELDDWARLGVEGHFHARNPWMPYHEIFPKQLSRIVGCREHEVVVMNQLTVNLHLLMVTFYRPDKHRYRIICEEKAFPSDQYAMESQVRYHGLDPEETIIEVKPRDPGRSISTEDITNTIMKYGETVALVLFGGVNYYTGQVFDMESITKNAHAVGAYAGFDLAHAAGNIDLHMHDWNADFGCWCSYKFLNSGPGGVAGVYIHEKHATDTRLPRFAGWWGYTKETRFEMKKGFDAIPSAEGWQLSNAPVLSMAVHKAALDIFDEAGMERLHEKRKLLSGYLHFMLEEVNKKQGEPWLEIITPSQEKERGCQVSMLVPKKGREIFDGLSEQGVIADWREPDVIRVAPVPLYNSFEEVWRFGDILNWLINRIFKKL